MNVTPSPNLAALEGCDYRMRRRVEMLQRVCVFRILATPDMAARETHAKLVPLRPQREAFLAAARARRDLSDFKCMFACVSHGWHNDAYGRSNDILGAGSGATGRDLAHERQLVSIGIGNQLALM